jgi:putative transposase
MEYRRAFIDNSMVFITIVTHNRLPILITNIEVIKKVVINVIKLYQFSIFAYSIQPDHIHCIIKPRNIEDYPKIIKSFKYAFTKYVGLVKPTYNKVWQNRYWEHTIRDKKDLNKKLGI